MATPLQYGHGHVPDLTVETSCNNAASAIELGNESFRCSKYDEALDHYATALAALAPIARALLYDYDRVLLPGVAKTQAEIHAFALSALRLGVRAGSNCAIVRLKGGDAAGAESQATLAIECGRGVSFITTLLPGQHTDDDGDAHITRDPVPKDVILEAKALLRRSAAREELGRPELAHSDATAATKLLRCSLSSTAAAQLAGQIDGSRVSVEAAVQSSMAQLLRTALQACHRTQSALRSARPCPSNATDNRGGGGDGEVDTSHAVANPHDAGGSDASDISAPRDRTGDRAGELLHSAHTLRLFLREAPTQLRCGAWFTLSMHLGNEFGLFKPSPQDLPLNLDVSVRRLGAGASAGHDEGDSGAAKSWRLHLRSATPLVDLAVAVRGCTPRQPAAIPGNGKWEVQATLVPPSAASDDDNSVTNDCYSCVALHLAAVPSSAEAPDVMSVVSLPIEVVAAGQSDDERKVDGANAGGNEGRHFAKRNSALTHKHASTEAVHSMAAALGVVSCREMCFGALRVLVAEAPAQLGIGGKVWDAAVALFHHLAQSPGGDSREANALVRGKHCLELGAGTGLVGLSCALLGAASVVTTDLDEVVPLLELNIALNCGEREDTIGSITAAEMAWGDDTHVQRMPELIEKLDIVVMSDVVYDPAGYDPLLQTLLLLCDSRPSGAAPLLIVLAHRHRHPEDGRFFRDLANYFEVTLAAHVPVGGNGPEPAAGTDARIAARSKTADDSTDEDFGEWRRDTKIFHIIRCKAKTLK